MTIKLFYDTETTGIPLFREPSEDPRQPHLVQLAACLVEIETRRTLASIDLVVRPDGWTIPEDVAAIHGITTEYAMDVGIPEAQAVDAFLSLWRQRTRIAHNESFDARIMRIALKRYVDPRDPGLVIAPSDDWKASAAECTQVLATPICQLPPTEKMRAANRHHFKSANLGEAFRHFTGRELEHAHSAMADVQGCMAVYFAIQDLQLESAPT